MLSGELVMPNEITGRVIASNKLCLAVMSDPRFARLFDSADRKAIAALVPWSRKLGDGVSMAEVVARREHLVVKDPYGAIGRSVHIGRECSAEEWRGLVESTDRQGWLVQEYVPAQRVPTPTGPYHRTMGVGFFNGRIVGYTGLLSRFTVTNSRFGPGGGYTRSSADVNEEARMRPRLKDDVRYLPLPDGVYLHSDLDSFTLPGKQSYAWIERLAPFLTGGTRAGRTHLGAAGQAPRRGRASDPGVARARTDRRRARRPTTLPDRDAAAGLRREIAFIRYALDSAEHRFQQYRERPVLLTGEGPVMAAVLRAGLRSGWRQVRVLAGVEDVARLRAVAQESRKDADQRVDVATIGSDHLAGLVTEADLVLQRRHPRR